MRELTKALMSYGLASTILGLQQMTQMLMSGGDMSDTTHVVNDVTAGMVHHMNRPMRTTFQAGDALQRTTVDILLGGWIPSVDAMRGALDSGTESMLGAASMGGGDRAPQAPMTDRATWDWADSQAPASMAAPRSYAPADVAV
jgi:hypothetical protein